MKKLYQLILIIATVVLTSCSTSQTGLSVGNMKNTICNFQNLTSGSGAELYADAVFDDNNNLVITIGNNKPAGTGFPSYYNLSFHIDNAFLNKCLLFIKWNDQERDKPYDLYEGIITFNDNEAIIDFN